MKRFVALVLGISLIAGGAFAQSKAVWRGNQYQIERGPRFGSVLTMTIWVRQLSRCGTKSIPKPSAW